MVFSLLLPGETYVHAWFGKTGVFVIRTFFFFKSATTLFNLLLLHALVWEKGNIYWHLYIVEESGYFVACCILLEEKL